MLPTVISMQLSVKPPADYEHGDAFFTLYLFPVAIMRSVVTETADVNTFVKRIPADQVPPMMQKAAQEIAEMESAKAKSAVLSLSGQLLFALMVRPRHFLLVVLNACELDIALATFSKAPFSLAFIELDVLWTNIDSLKRILYALGG